MKLKTKMAALAIAGLTGLSTTAAAPAHAAGPVASRAGANLHLNWCPGGGVWIWAPYRTGKKIQTGTAMKCTWSRPLVGKFLVESQLDQYRGLGHWRKKAIKSKTYNQPRKIDLRLNPTWKCSGGKQLYRNRTRTVHSYRWAGRPVNDTYDTELLKKSLQKKIQRYLRC